MKPQKAIGLCYGAVAHVDEDCSQETIDALNKMVEHVYNLKPEEWEKIKRKSNDRRNKIEGQNQHVS